MSFDLFAALGLNSYYFLFPVFFFFYFFWINLWVLNNFNSRSVVFWNKVSNFFYTSNKSDQIVNVFLSGLIISNVFFFLMNNNIWNLLPFISSTSSNLVFTLTFAFMFWCLINLSSLGNNSLQYFSHFTPTGSPSALIPFINIIEVVSNLIRPVTLGVRLAVNLLTGHLLLSMYSNAHVGNLLFMDYVIFAIMFLFGLFIFFYEFCVCLIQSLVYSLLINKYFDEHTSN